MPENDEKKHDKHGPIWHAPTQVNVYGMEFSFQMELARERFLMHLQGGFIDESKSPAELASGFFDLAESFIAEGAKRGYLREIKPATDPLRV
jgi:hypothetical protein